MEKARASYVPPPPSAKPKAPPSFRANTRKGIKKRPLEDAGVDRAAKRGKKDDGSSEAGEEPSEDADGDSQAFKQPTLITGAKLKDYQLEGVAWMAGLYQNGISGILGACTFELMQVPWD